MATFTNMGDGWELRGGYGDPFLNVIDGGCQAKYDMQCPCGPPVYVSHVGFPDEKLDEFERRLGDLIHQICPQM